MDMWRHFRKEYVHTSTEHLCNTVWKIWAMSPEVSKIVDPYNLTTWLTLWEIIQLGQTCKYTKALGAAYMIHYLQPETNIVICRVFDKIKNDIYITAIVESKFLLHPEYTEIIKMNNNDYQIQELWSLDKILEKIKYKTE